MLQHVLESTSEKLTKKRLQLVAVIFSNFQVAEPPLAEVGVALNDHLSIIVGRLTGLNVQLRKRKNNNLVRSLKGRLEVISIFLELR